MDFGVPIIDFVDLCFSLPPDVVEVLLYEEQNENDKGNSADYRADADDYCNDNKEDDPNCP